MLKFLTVFFGFILAAQSSFAEKVRLLADDREALQARVDILQQAKSEIIAEYFSVWNDDQSIGGMALLIDAAQRGVKVKVIIDAISNTIPRAVFAALRQKGMDIYGNQNLEVKVYNPIGINLLRATHRDHAKMIIVDGHTIISGGRNVGDKYFGLSKDRNFHDLDIIMSGPAVQDARQNFLKAWNSKIVSDVYLYEFEEENLDPWKCRHADDWVQCDERRLAALKEIDKEEKRLRDTLNEIFLPEKDDVVRSGTNTDWLKDAADSVDVEFISHRPDRLVTRHTNDMTEKLLNLLKGAQSDVNIISPYLVPTENLMEAFRELRVKGIPIRIITNSLKSTDNLFAQAAYRFRKNELIRMGIEIYEYNGPNTVHAKTAIIDGQVGLIGTYNLDPRSAFINREIGFIMKDSNNNELIKQLESTIEKFRSNSFLVGRDGVEHNKDKEFEGVSSGKKKLLHGVTLLLPLIYNQI